MKMIMDEWWWMDEWGWWWWWWWGSTLSLLLSSPSTLSLNAASHPTKNQRKKSGLLTSRHWTVVGKRFAEVRVRRLRAVRVRIGDVESKRTVRDCSTRSGLVQVSSPVVNGLLNPTNILSGDAQKSETSK